MCCTQAVQLADHLGDRITELTNNLQRMCAVVASSSDSSLAEIRQEISSVAAVQVGFTYLSLAALNNREAATSEGHVDILTGLSTHCTCTAHASGGRSMLPSSVFFVLQREVSQFRVAVRHLFTKSLEVAQLQDASVLDDSRSIVSPSRRGAPSPSRDGWM